MDAAGSRERELEQGNVADAANVPTAKRQPTKKQQRQAQAERRRRLKPLSDKVRKIETRLSRLRAEVDSLDERLADTSLYSEAGRAAELKQLLQDQAERKAEIQTLEWDWLEASEALETAD